MNGHKKLLRLSYVYLVISVVTIIVAMPIATLAQLPPKPVSELSKPQETQAQSIDRELLRAILVNPKDPTNQRRQHSLQFNSKELNQEIKNLDEEIASNPEDVVSYYQRGFLKYSKGLYQQAIDEDFSKALTLNAKDDIAYFNIGLSYYQIYELNQQDKDLKQAIDSINRAIQIDPAGWLDWLREQRRGPYSDQLTNQFNAAIAAYDSNNPNLGLRNLKKMRETVGNRNCYLVINREFCNRVENCIKDFQQRKRRSASCQPYPKPNL